MRRAKGVIFAFDTSGESGKATALPKRADAAAAAGQNLVRIGLVANIPDQPVGGRVEDVMQRHCQLDHAKPSAEMPAGHGNRIDHLAA